MFLAWTSQPTAPPYHATSFPPAPHQKRRSGPLGPVSGTKPHTPTHHHHHPRRHLFGRQAFLPTRKTTRTRAPLFVIRISFFKPPPFSTPRYRQCFFLSRIYIDIASTTTRPINASHHTSTLGETHCRKRKLFTRLGFVSLLPPRPRQARPCRDIVNLH
jgi:hypothetical protein